MPKVTKPLTNTEVDKSKPKDKEYTHQFSIPFM